MMDASSYELCSAAENIKLWKYPDLQVLQEFDTGPGSVKSLSWCNNGSLIGLVSDAFLKPMVASVKQGNIVDIPLSNIQCTAFGNTSKRFLYLGDSLGSIFIWNLKGRNIHKKIEGIESCLCLAIDYHDSLLSIGSRSKIMMHSLKSLCKPDELNTGNMKSFCCMKYSHADKSMLGAVTDCGTFGLWDSKSSKLTYSTTCHESPATDLVFSPINTKLCVTCALDKSVCFHDMREHLVTNTMLMEYPVTCVDLYHDGKTLALGSSKGSIELRDLRSYNKCLKYYKGHTSPVVKVCFNPLNLKKKWNSECHGSSEILALSPGVSTTEEFNQDQLNFDTKLSQPSMEGIFTPETDKGRTKSALNLTVNGTFSPIESSRTTSENFFPNNCDSPWHSNTRINSGLPSTYEPDTRICSGASCIESTSNKANLLDVACQTDEPCINDLENTLRLEELKDEFVKESWSIKVAIVRLQEGQKAMQQQLEELLTGQKQLVQNISNNNTLF